MSDFSYYSLRKPKVFPLQILRRYLTNEDRIRKLFYYIVLVFIWKKNLAFENLKGSHVRKFLRFRKLFQGATYRQNQPEVSKKVVSILRVFTHLLLVTSPDVIELYNSHHTQVCRPILGLPLTQADRRISSVLQSVYNKSKY